MSYIKYDTFFGGDVPPTSTVEKCANRIYDRTGSVYDKKASTWTL